MKTYYLFFLSLILLFGCASNKQSSQESSEILDDLILNKSFEVVSDWAQPQVTNAMVQLGNAGLFPPGSTVGMINLQGNANYLKMQDGKVSGYLPFFGERQVGGAYNSNRTGIEFEGVPNNLKVEPRKKGGYLIVFDINDKNRPTENYRVILELFPGLSSALAINSSQRFNIRYRGKVKALAIDNES